MTHSDEFRAAFQRHAGELRLWSSVEAPSLSDLNRSELADARANLDLSLESIERVIDLLPEHERENVFLALWQLISAATTIGSRATLTESGRTLTRRDGGKQAGAAKLHKRATGEGIEGQKDEIVRRYLDLVEKQARPKVNADFEVAGIKPIGASAHAARRKRLKDI